MPLAHAEIHRLFSDQIYDEALEYLKKGAVQSAEVVDGKRISALVSDAAKKNYRQTISLNFAKNGSLRSIQGLCTCPVGYNCKHVAAALLAAADEIEPPGATAEAAASPAAAPAPSALSDPELEGWLAHIRSVDAQETSTEEEVLPRLKERIFYVVGLDRKQRVTVTPMKGNLKRNGEVGAGARSYGFGNLDQKEPPSFVAPADVSIFRMLQAFGMSGRGLGSQGPGPRPEELDILLTRVIATGRARWRSIAGVAMHAGDPREGRLEWRDDAGKQRLVLLDSEGQQLQAVPSAPPNYFDTTSGAFGHLDLAMPPQLAAALLAAPAVPPEAANEVADALSELTAAEPPLPSTLSVEERDGGKPVAVLQLFTLPAKQRRSPYYQHGAQQVKVPALRVAFEYEGHLTAAYPLEDPQFTLGGCVVRLRRDHRSEKALVASLKDSGAQPPTVYRHLEFGDGVMKGDLAFPESNRFEEWVFADTHEDPRSAAITFTAERLPELRDEGWRVEIASDWPYRIYDGPLSFHAGIEESSGVDWFSFALKIEVGEQTLDLLPIIVSVIKILPIEEGGTLPDDFDLEIFLEELVLYPDLPDGGLVRLEGETLAPLVRAFIGIHGLGDSFHQAEAAKAAMLADALAGSGITLEGGEALKELGGRLRALSNLAEVSAPRGLKARLRPYQAKGYGWLDALGETGFGACLADDMGLGKTVQALALLVKRHLVEGCENPSLLVVPTSLVGNWLREAERFAPDLRILVLHGTKRKDRFDQIPDHDLIITTYPLIHRDHEALFKHRYELAILDEAQAVKNPRANASKRIREIRARQRIAMTGTPLENNLQELWALYDWLIPGLLGDRRSFTETYRKPIESGGDETAQARLNDRIKPFLLRRTKEEVASELPPKTEIAELVPLSGTQRGLYETLRTAMDARVRAAIRAKGINASRITILDALLKLRQACCDPALVKLDAARKVTESAKRARLMEMLESLVDEGRRILVFSQFVEMLRLIEPEISERGWDYAVLTGQTKKRQEVVNRFQKGDTPIFLMSLKAGGVGLNLTAADTVILYDPWWNPAVERQAMDRAHRIGQDKPVFVYRMVAEGTVEAAIQELQAKKQALADALFEGTGKASLSLSEDDLAALFQPLEDAA